MNIDRNNHSSPIIENNIIENNIEKFLLNCHTQSAWYWFAKLWRIFTEKYRGFSCRIANDLL